jgi:hypothetical protein
MASLAYMALGALLAVAVVLALWLFVSLIDDLPGESRRSTR